MNIQRLGPRASILLGLLDSPMTADEIAYRIERAVDLVDDLLDALGDAQVYGRRRSVLRSLADEGTLGIARQLARLRDAGLVESVEAGSDVLYHRLPLS